MSRGKEEDSSPPPPLLKNSPLNGEEKVNNNNLLSKPTPSTPTYNKTHCMTVCVVPPPKAKYKHVWNAITKARTELKDPGLYRWPPHVNILYPFIDIDTNIVNIDVDADADEDEIKTDNMNVLDKTTKSDSSSSDNDIKKNKDGDNNINSDKENDVDNDVDNDSGNDDKPNSVLNLLQNAIEQCEPFTVSLDSFGTFGGKYRGVLFLSPRSYRRNDHENDKIDIGNHSDHDDQHQEQEPLVELQSILQSNFPFCNDQRKHGGTFTPHMTLSHFPSLESALQGQEMIQQWWGNPSHSYSHSHNVSGNDEDDDIVSGITAGLEFDVHEIYVLKRAGDGGQFKIIATLPLGKQNNGGESGDTSEQLTSGIYTDDGDGDISSSISVQVHDPPLAFPDMPVEEEQWVYEERIKLKERRNGGGKRRRRRSGRRKKERLERGPSRSTDTPEEIARKRAERAAKKERLAQEIALLEQAIHGMDDNDNDDD